MAQLKDLIVNGDAALNGNVVLNHDPTSAMQAATKQYVDNKVSSGEYVVEVPTSVYTGMTSSVSGDATTYNAMVDAMQAGKKIYFKIRAEQIYGSAGTSSNYIYLLVTSYSSSAGFSCYQWDYFGSSYQLIQLLFGQPLGVTMWVMGATPLMTASGVSF